jgi:hypothetical protein
MTLKKYKKNRGYSLSPYGEKKDTFVPLKIKWIEQIPEFKSFNSEIESLYDFCKHVQTDTDNSKIQHMKNYIVIRTMSIMENKLKSILVNFVDKYNVLPSKILDLDVIPISLDQFDEYKKDDITKGKIVASIFIMNKANIGKCFGRINDVSFFSWAQKIIFKGQTGSDNWLHNQLESYYIRRNSLVHNLEDISEDIEVLQNDIKMIDAFVNKTYLLTAINLKTKNSLDKVEKKKWNKISNDNLGISLNEFKKITQYYKTY